MPVALVADAHLGGPGGDGGELVRELEGLDSERCSLLLVLGDMFHIWVGDRRYETPEIGRLMPCLDGVRARGVPVRYVEGNRDFYLDDSVYARHFDGIEREVSFEDDGVRYLAVHGDGLDPGDWQFRFWRFASKTPVSRFFCRRLPASLARGFVTAMDRRLETTNFSHKMRIPEQHVQGYGQRRLQEGYDVVLMGHFHEERLWRVEGGEVRVVRAWFHERRLEWLS